MGRMTELIKHADPRRTPPAELARTADAEPEPTADMLEFDGEVPFIEVGGKDGVLRFVDRPAAGATVTVEPIPEPEPQLRLVGESLPPGIFRIQFAPVHPGQRADRGFGPELIAFHQPGHAVSEQYRQLFAAIQGQIPGAAQRVLLFTAAAPEAGTTTVVLNLAITIAQQEAARVLVVDANWDRPALGARLGLPPAPGLRDVLASRMPPAWVVHETHQPHLRAITAGRPTLPRHDAALPQVIDQLRQDYDWVLVDSACDRSPADLMPLPDCCDALYLVTRQADADSEAVRDLQQAILDQSGTLRGRIQTQR